jgi:alkanesulfonate monooxygenase SsuD/methylene tetrahydromethanopterin reductase-like flavin-dependent oxidoreductase (luciferase family)
MESALMMDGDYRAGQTQREAFDEVLTAADLAETLGFDGVWLAERHFSPQGAVLISSMQQALGLSGIIVEPNVGGGGLGTRGALPAPLCPRGGSSEYHLPHVLDLVVLAALAERMKTLLGSLMALSERRHGA